MSEKDEIQKLIRSANSKQVSGLLLEQIDTRLKELSGRVVVEIDKIAEEVLHSTDQLVEADEWLLGHRDMLLRRLFGFLSKEPLP